MFSTLEAAAMTQVLFFPFRSLHRRRNVLVILCMFLTVGCVVTPLLAQRGEQAVPRQVQIDWLAVVRDALTLSPQLSTNPTNLPPRLRARVAGRLAGFAIKDGTTALALLNELVIDLIPGVATIPIPVLVPFETTRFLAEKARVKADSPRLQPGEHRRYLYGAGGTLQLVPDTTGYDALVTYEPNALRDLGVASMRRRMVHIAGASQSYGGDQPGELVEDMQAQFPGLRRQQNDNEVSYTFRKYGVPYFAVVSCSGRPLDPNGFKCEQAETLLRVAVRNLQLIGGNPLPVRVRASAVRLPHPTRVSPDFKYYSPGKLLDGTDDDGMQQGSADRNTYGDILFPIKTPPNYAQPQVFMHVGNCLSTSGTTDKMVPLPKQTGDQHARYHCKQNAKQLLHWEGHPENYGYPWRDNFCESRLGTVGSTPECPARRGHQGQDIRPSSCPGPAGAESCQTDVHQVVAVAKGNACRDGNKLRLRFNSTTLYYVYLHMNTNTMDAAHIPDQQCTPVEANRLIGKVGNFQDVIGGTTTHLHFEIHPVDPMSRYNPYMTLIRAYERRIGAIGTELP
jgi:hypothetical protein